MECNKDDAVRAMQLSEKKIQIKDFKGAKEMALKAQRLYPQLDNISRLITVCEVHCSAEKKVGGSEMDWYGILQIQQSDDEATIKKQYRKLGLLLHPDKNSFAGAEAAFKLVGEANRVLADQGSRSKYDFKYNASLGTGNRTLGHQSYNFFGANNSDAASSSQNIPQSWYTSVNLHQPANVQQPMQRDSIRIACPSCKRMYDYNFANRLIFCQRCLGIFDASDLSSESLGNQPNHIVAPSQNAGGTGVAEVGGASKTVKRDFENGVQRSSPLKSKDSKKARNMHRKRGDNSTFGSGGSSKTRKGAKADSGDFVQEKTGNSSEVSVHHTRISSRSKINISFYDTLTDDSADDDGVGDVNVKDGVNVRSDAAVNADVDVGPSKVRESQLSAATGKKRVNASADSRGGRQTVLALPASGEYNKLGSGKQRVWRKRSNTDEIELQQKEKSAADNRGNQSMADNRGRKSMANSNGSKPVADGNGSKSVADNNGSTSMADNNGSTSVADGNGRKSVADYNGNKSMADNNGNKSMVSMRKMVPEPEFGRFVLSKDVLQKAFKANQIWVLYDRVDGMPRRYAYIMKVFNPGFRVKITWLQPDSDDQGEVNWSKKLPVACGKFGLALTEEVTDHTVFSHEYVHSTKSKDKRSFRIYPRKGETWALYQDWHLGWSTEPEKHSKYKFDYVELLTDFSERTGAGVAYLGKVKGFVSLFKPAEQHGVLQFQVHANELYKFSHQIPSHKMTGKEGYGVPEDSFELDPASLPATLFDRRSIVTVAKPSGFIPSGRPRAAQGRRDSERGEVKNGNLNDEPILID